MAGATSDAPTVALRLPAAAPIHLDLAHRTRSRRALMVLGVGCMIAATVFAGSVALGGGTFSAPSSDSAVATAPAGVAGASDTGSTGVVGDAYGGSFDAASALEEQRRSDFEALSGSSGSWFPQVSSKRVGMTVDGTTYDEAGIWALFEDASSRYPQPRLVWSGDWGTFRDTDFWVIVIDRPSSDAADAVAWCDAEGIPADGCYAKRLDFNGGAEGNTVTRDG